MSSVTLSVRLGSYLGGVFPRGRNLVALMSFRHFVSRYQKIL